jgi:tetratricopeptide (TPR) repeat protein
MTDLYDELRLSQSSELADIQRIIAKLRQDWEQPAMEIAMPDETARHLKLLDEADAAFASEESRAEYDGELARSKGPDDEADPAAERLARYVKWLDDAKRYYRRAQYDLAGPAIEKALQYRTPESEDPEAFCLASDIYRKLGRFDEAVRTINEAIILSPDDVEFYLSKAILQFHYMALSARDDSKLDSAERTKRYREYSEAALATLAIALEEAEAQGDSTLVATCHVAYARQYLAMGDEQPARSHTNSALVADVGSQDAGELQQRLQELVETHRRELEESWLMIAKDSTRNIGLFVFKDIVTKMPYHQPGGNITWENCTLRKWLNTEFYNSLPDFIKSRVVEVTNQNPDNSEYKTPGGNPTKDRVFLLSLDEVQKYFKDNSARVAKYNGSDCWWWLRSPGYGAGCAAIVYDGGDVDAIGSYVDFDVGVRPALWLNL